METQMTETLELEARDKVGGNNPPADPFPAHRAHLADWVEQAKQWCDGALIENAAQAEAVELLEDTLSKGWTAADTARKAAKKPHDDAAQAVQDQWLPILKPAATAKAACLAALGKWRAKALVERAEQARIARVEADRIATAAAEAARAVDRSNIAAVEAVEAMVTEAKTATKVATVAERDQSKGTGLRANWVIKGFAEDTWDDVNDRRVTAKNTLLRHYLTANPEALIEACLELARADAKQPPHRVPGLIVVNEPKAV